MDTLKAPSDPDVPYFCKRHRDTRWICMALTVLITETNCPNYSYIWFICPSNKMLNLNTDNNWLLSSLLFSNTYTLLHQKLLLFFLLSWLSYSCSLSAGMFGVLEQMGGFFSIIFQVILLIWYCCSDCQ